MKIMLRKIIVIIISFVTIGMMGSCEDIFNDLAVNPNQSDVIPVLHLYWRAENSNEWILLRCDADYLFNCNYTGDYIWDETTNYVKVMPQSWH